MAVAAGVPGAARLPAVRGGAGETEGERVQHVEEIFGAFFACVLLVVAVYAEVPGGTAQPRREEGETGATKALPVKGQDLTLTRLRFLTHHFLDLRSKVRGVVALSAVLFGGTAPPSRERPACDAKALLVLTHYPRVRLRHVRV